MTVLKRGRFGRILFVGAVLALSSMLSGCLSMSMYVDSTLKDVNVSQVKKPARPQDAQLFFNFQSKGTNNAKVTEALKGEVTKVVSTSGLFAASGPDPSLSGAILSITLNNVPAEDAASKGFTTGLTLGLAGSTVTDGYVCTVEYTPPTNGQRITKITKTVNHAIYTTVGNKGAPPNGIKAQNADDAALTMTRQVVTAALRELSQDPVFK